MLFPFVYLVSFVFKLLHIESIQNLRGATYPSGIWETSTQVHAVCLCTCVLVSLFTSIACQECYTGKSVPYRGQLVCTPAILLLAFLLAGCAAIPGLPAGTSAPRLISRQQAIDIAVKTASMSAPEISGALEPLTNIRAEQIALHEAEQRIPVQGSFPLGYTGITPVWYVTMDGLWQNEAAAPGATAVPSPYHHAILVLDAVTGDEIHHMLTP